MRRKTWIIAVVILVLAGGLGGFMYWRWANSPRYALQQAALALKAQDMDNFFHYVNLRDIFDSFVAASSRDLKSREDQNVDDWTKYSRQLGRHFAHLFLPKLFNSFEPQIKQVVTRYLQHLNNSQIIGIVAAVTVADIDTQGETARVTMTDPHTKETLRFQMRRQGDPPVWQIVSINYQDMKRFYKREFQQGK